MFEGVNTVYYDATVWRPNLVSKEQRHRFDLCGNRRRKHPRYGQQDGQTSVQPCELGQKIAAVMGVPNPSSRVGE